MISAARALGRATAPLAFVMAAPLAAQTPVQAGGRATDPDVVPSSGRSSISARFRPVGPSRPYEASASPIASIYPSAGSGDGVTAEGYNFSRWTEDWTRYRDPKTRDDILDRLKYLPLDPDGDVYVTLSGEARVRMNFTTNPDLRERERQRQDIARLVGGVDLHVGSHVRFYGEVAHGGLSGENLGNPAATLRNDLVVQQSFVDVAGTVGGAELGVRYGRQTFVDGPNLITSVRDNNTIFFVFNGVRGWARARGVRFDAFDFRTTVLGPGGTGDDRIDRARRFSGVSGGIILPPSLVGDAKLYLDPFVWRLRNRAQIWGTAARREERDYYGLHLYGDAGPLNLDWTLNHQGGRYDGRRIAAWQLFAAQTYRLGKSRLAPRIGFHVDYASGGGAYTGGKLRTALAPFGNNIYYSYQLFATPTNLIAVAPNFTFSPLKGVRLTAEYQFTWRDDVRDAVYRANGAAFAGTQNVRARRIAETTRTQLVYTISPRVSFTARYEHLDAGPALTRAGYASSDFFAGWLSFRL